MYNYLPICARVLILNLTLELVSTFELFRVFFATWYVDIPNQPATALQAHPPHPSAWDFESPQDQERRAMCQQWATGIH